jgi:hypothetical protein
VLPWSTIQSCQKTTVPLESTYLAPKCSLYYEPGSSFPSFNPTWGGPTVALRPKQFCKGDIRSPPPQFNQPLRSGGLGGEGIEEFPCAYQYPGLKGGQQLLFGRVLKRGRVVHIMLLIGCVKWRRQSNALTSRFVFSIGLINAIYAVLQPLLHANQHYRWHNM